MHMKYLGLDYGTRRIGLATADSDVGVATAFRVIHRTSLRQDVARVVEIVRALQVTDLVTGLPHRLQREAQELQREAQELRRDAQEGEARQPEAQDRIAPIRSFVRQIKRECDKQDTPLAVHWQDERFSTTEVLTHLKLAGISQAAARDTVDARAAAVILQGYLDQAATKD